MEAGHRAPGVCLADPADLAGSRIINRLKTKLMAETHSYQYKPLPPLYPLFAISAQPSLPVQRGILVPCQRKGNRKRERSGKRETRVTKG